MINLGLHICAYVNGELKYIMSFLTIFCLGGAPNVVKKMTGSKKNVSCNIWKIKLAHLNSTKSIHISSSSTPGFKLRWIILSVGLLMGRQNNDNNNNWTDYITFYSLINFHPSSVCINLDNLMNKCQNFVFLLHHLLGRNVIL